MEINQLALHLHGFGHPVRILCLVLLENERSPSELTEILAQTHVAPPLGVVAYHMRMLKQYDMIYETRTQPRRGALEHFYKRTENADVVLALIGKLMGETGLPKKGPGRKKVNGKRDRDLLLALDVVEATAEEVAMAA